MATFFPKRGEQPIHLSEDHLSLSNVPRHKIIKMSLKFRLSTSWATLKLDKIFPSSRASVVRAVFGIFFFGLLAYLLWLPIFYLFSAFHRVSPHYQSLLIEPGDE
jgi:hypothetical protein